MLRALLIGVLCTVPAGCERAALSGAAGSAVLARVNGAEISLAGLAPAARHGEAVREALERTIERELLVQRALELRLDRDPRVATAMEAARRRALADAYLERLAPARGPSTQAVHAFYAGNPALFAERRIYRLRELVVVGAEPLLAALRDEAARRASLDALAAWLRSRDAHVSTRSLSQPAEELPLAYLPRLARMRAGEIAVLARPAQAGFAGGATVIELVHAEPAPLAEPQAAPLIERFLVARARLEARASEVRRLRQAARIEYFEGKS